MSESPRSGFMCAGTTAYGTPCEAYRFYGSQFCWAHDPKIQTPERKARTREAVAEGRRRAHSRWAPVARRQSELKTAFPMLSVRVLRNLERNGFTPHALRTATDDELLNLRNFGAAMLREVRAFVSDPWPPECNWVGEGVP